MGTCPFCPPPSDRIFHQGDRVVALWDGFPVSPGHALVVPRRHVASWFEASAEERLELLDALDAVRDAILMRHAPDGFNVGMNLGEAAGQTVLHLHLHVIPRYRGDAADPRGGVRWVLPAKAAYWKAT
jgi:diadenosine tetraphosphate (Ap4A) HIT family hydrolase